MGNTELGIALGILEIATVVGGRNAEFRIAVDAVDLVSRGKDAVGSLAVRQLGDRVDLHVVESDAGEVLIVGDTQSVPEATFRGLHRVKSGRPRYPDASALLDLAAGPLQKGVFPSPEDLRPLYLREPDVSIAWKQFRQEGPWDGTA